jgi:23S rRNA (uracil1939-C5)-methyltransferase
MPLTPDRPCPHYPNCVGCAFIGRPYTEQLRLKRERVLEAFAPFSSLRTLEIPDVVGSPRAFGYRNQAKLVARRAGSGLLLGIYRPGTHQIVDVSQCPVHHPLINHVLRSVREILEHYAIPTYDERTQAGTLRYVVIRVSGWTKQAQVILVTRARALPHAREISRALCRHREVVGVVQNVNPSPGNVIFGSEYVPLAGEMALVERVGFLKLKTRPGAFLQANISVARKVYERAVQWAAPQPAETCFDLYCGVGALSFHLAMAAKLVVGIEASRTAILDAKENVRLNGFHNVRFHCGDVAELLPDMAPRFAPIDVVALNPPRKGADAATRAAIAACSPRCIVYVSCNPVTLGRDLDWFAARGYATQHVQPFDLLPQTEHIECVAALVRA